MKVTILRGIPGSGKSYWANWQRLGLPAPVIVSADAYFCLNDAGEYRFDPKQLPAAHNWALKRFLDEILLNAAIHLIVDNTNIHAWEVAPYYRLAEVYGAEVRILRFPCDPVLAMRRNVHGVPPITILRMAEALAREVLPSWWQEDVFIPEMEEKR